MTVDSEESNPGKHHAPCTVPAVLRLSQRKGHGRNFNMSRDGQIKNIYFLCFVTILKRE
jgi:hypothetical protein